MTNRMDRTEPIISRQSGQVIMQMTPQQAQLVAASIWMGDADHTDWLDSMADQLASAADRGKVFQEGYATAGADRLDIDAFAGESFANNMAVETTVLPQLLPDLAAFAEAMTGAADAELAVAAEMEAAAVEAARVAREAVAAAAQRRLEAAQTAKAARASATAHVAELVAQTVRMAAIAVQRDADDEAQKVVEAAARAASLVAWAVVPGTEAVNLAKAFAVNATVRAAAVAKAEETAIAAARVARAAATAALDAAAAAADAAMAVELEVAITAAAIDEVAAEAAQLVATETAHAARLVSAADR